MISKMKTTSSDIFAFEGKGQISQEDYIKEILPIFDNAKHTGNKIRFLFYLGEDFKGFTAGAAWQDFKLGIKYFSCLDKCALVSDIAWIRNSVRLFSTLMPFPVKVFTNAELHSAMAWLDAGEIGLNHHLDKAMGLLTVEIDAPLSSENFEVLSNTVDTWIEKEGSLNGLVIHLKKFPGWENVGSFFSHIQFVKNHHRKIRKVVLCADGIMPSIVPQLAEHFVEAKIKHFEFNDLEGAKKWAIE